MSSKRKLMDDSLNLKIPSHPHHEATQKQNKKSKTPYQLMVLMIDPTVLKETLVVNQEYISVCWNHTGIGINLPKMYYNCVLIASNLILYRK